MCKQTIPIQTIPISQNVSRKGRKDDWTKFTEKSDSIVLVFMSHANQYRGLQNPMINCINNDYSPRRFAGFSLAADAKTTNLAIANEKPTKVTKAVPTRRSFPNHLSMPKPRPAKQRVNPANSSPAPTNLPHGAPSDTVSTGFEGSGGGLTQCPVIKNSKSHLNSKIQTNPMALKVFTREKQLPARQSGPECDRLVIEI